MRQLCWFCLKFVILNCFFYWMFTIRELGRRPTGEEFRRAQELEIQTDAVELRTVSGHVSPDEKLNAKMSDRPDTDVISTVGVIAKANGFAFLLVLNSGYINITKSWICNVECMHVLPQTAFVTSDKEAYWALKNWKPNLNMILYNSGTAEEMTIGSVDYRKFILYRLKLIKELLIQSLSVFLVESDSVWFRNPGEFIHKKSNADIICTENEEGRAMAGFVFLNATENTLQFWSNLVERFDSVMADYLAGKGEYKPEMTIMNHLIQTENISIAWLPNSNFFSGKWYTERANMASSNSPVVIQNNFLIGNEAKIGRAKEWGHWFLSEDGKSCQGVRFCPTM